MSPRLRRWLRRLLEPRIFVPTLLSLALLAFALGMTNLPRVGDRLHRIPPGTVVAVLLLASGYLVVKGVQLRFLLDSLDIRVPWRSLLLAYCIGEMTLTIPSGIYAQNYVLQRLGLVGFARSAAATTAVLTIEWAILIATLAVVGVPGWAWLRPLLLAFSLFMATVILGLAHWERPKRWAQRLAEEGRLARLARGAIEIAEGVWRVLSPRVVVPCAGLGLLYMAALVEAVARVAHGTGMAGLTFAEAASIYFFSLGVAMTVGGVLTQLGVIEVAGLGAARAWGYDLSDALAMLLGFRVLWMGSVWIVCGATSFGLWRQLRVSGADGGHEAPH